jgi:transglutaminase-like putative cysteine protease
MRRSWKRALPALLLLAGATAISAQEKPALTTRFNYEANVPQAEGAVRLWLPVPSDSEWQSVKDVTVDGVETYQLTREAKFGNRMVYIEAPQAPLKVNIGFTVERRNVRVLGNENASSNVMPGWFDLTLKPDAKVPIGGRFGDMAKQIAGDKTTPTEKMRAFFDNVVATMQYDYKKESPKLGEGDVAFVCDYKKGNCSDLHSYIISMGRSLGVPAVLEYGFPITGIPMDEPLKSEGTIGGYHCWTWFKDGNRWIPLDASDARRWLDKDRADQRNYLFGNLITERAAVALSRGRDITLVPAQKAPPLNYFIYPYAESNGDPVKADWTFAYKILDRAAAKP